MEREYEGTGAFLFELNHSNCLTWPLLLVYYQRWMAITKIPCKNEWFLFGTSKQESFETFLKLVLKHYKTDKLMRGLLYFPCSLSKSQFNFHFLIHYKLLVAKICCKFLPSTFYDLNVLLMWDIFLKRTLKPIYFRYFTAFNIFIYLTY